MNRTNVQRYSALSTDSLRKAEERSNDNSEPINNGFGCRRSLYAGNKGDDCRVRNQILIFQ